MRIFMQTVPSSDQMPRYYELILQQDLLGGWTLIRQWGAANRFMGARRDHFESLTDAQTALARVRDLQAGKGFRVMFVQGGG